MAVFKTLLFFCIVLLTHQNSFAAPIKEKECPTELNFENNTIQQTLRISSFKPAEDGDQFKEALGCVWKNQGLVSEDGVIQLDNFRQAMVKEFRKEYPSFVAQDKAQEVLRYCRNVRGPNAAETAANMINCLAKWKIEDFLDIEREQSY